MLYVDMDLSWELVIIVENVAQVVTGVDEGDKHCLMGYMEWGTTLVHFFDQQL